MLSRSRRRLWGASVSGVATGMAATADRLWWLDVLHGKDGIRSSNDRSAAGCRRRLHRRHPLVPPPGPSADASVYNSIARLTEANPLLEYVKDGVCSTDTSSPRGRWRFRQLPDEASGRPFASTSTQSFTSRVFWSNLSDVCTARFRRRTIGSPKIGDGDFHFAFSAPLQERLMRTVTACRRQCRRIAKTLPVPVPMIVR